MVMEWNEIESSDCLTDWSRAGRTVPTRLEQVEIPGMGESPPDHHHNHRCSSPASYLQISHPVNQSKRVRSMNLPTYLA